jgi:hypothetical protein
MAGARKADSQNVTKRYAPLEAPRDEALTTAQPSQQPRIRGHRSMQLTSRPTQASNRADAAHDVPRARHLCVPWC